MADFLAGFGHSLGGLLGYLGIGRGNVLEATFYCLGATTFLLSCVAVRSAVRIAFLACSARK